MFKDIPMFLPEATTAECKEIFKIIKVLNHLPITMFTLSDVNDKEIDGNFYPEELSVVKGNLFKVEKIIKRRHVDVYKQGVVGGQNVRAVLPPDQAVPLHQ